MEFYDFINDKGHFKVNRGNIIAMPGKMTSRLFTQCSLFITDHGEESL